ncbi:uncharacterized protein LOC128337189 [Hemicordylus capensis]|uniref:uncharacterized protein LOC128337189 n=1 Tax=Hemicordylus capensis TaxID=884348 RepID=UPI0023020669|nr:uncharacterized protein LOC128337189 [Hemicordylus capensis]
MAPKKAPSGKGKRPAVASKVCTAQPDSSSEDERDMELSAIRALIARLEAIAGGQEALQGYGGAPSGAATPRERETPTPANPHRMTRAAKRTKLMQGFTDRLAALEAAMASILAASGTRDAEGLSGDGGTASGSTSGAVSEDQAGQGDAALLAAGSRRFPKAREDACWVMEPWSVEALRAIEASIAPRTRVAYGRRVEAFQHFRSQAGIGQAWPAPPEHLMRYLVHLRAGGLAVSTMSGHLAALAFYAKARGLPDHSGNFRVWHMLEGWARKSPAQPDQHRPITPDALQRAVQGPGEVCSSPHEVMLFWAALLVAFYGAFRVGELFPGGPETQ